MFVGDDPHLSECLRRFLSSRSRRVPGMDERAVRSAAGLRIDGVRTAAPEDLVGAMVGFEQRYGGLCYRVIGGNDMEYSLDGDPTGYRTPLGLAFAGILDGDWTWGVDVLVDGRTAMGPGRWPYRVIDRSVDQRLEKHALLVSVRHWPHRTFTFVTPTGIAPLVHGAMAPPVTKASGTADLWFSNEATAVEISLSGWPPEQNTWTIRYFARPDVVIAAHTAVADMIGHTVKPSDWCALCAKPRAPGDVCLPTGAARAK